MELKISQVKAGDTIHVVSYEHLSETLVDTIFNINSITFMDNNGYLLVNNSMEYFYDENICKAFSSYGEAMGYALKLLENHNILEYCIPYLVSMLNSKTSIYIIREKTNSSGKRVKYVDECKILEIKYVNNWKIKTKSVDQYLITLNNISSINDKIFFNKEVAFNRINRK